MVITRKGKFCIAIAFVALAGILSFIGIKYFQNSSNKKVTNTSTIIPTDKDNVEKTKLLKKAEEDSLQALLVVPETKQLYALFSEKNYDEMISVAKTACPTLKGTSQLVCYGYYAQALEAKNKVPELAVLSDEVLKTVAINDDETAKNVWVFIQENAKKGVNPNSVKMGMDDSVDGR